MERKEQWTALQGALASLRYLWVEFVSLGMILEATFGSGAGAGRGRDLKPNALRHCCLLQELCDASCLPPSLHVLLLQFALVR